MAKYIVSLWSGRGYYLEDIEVKANNVDEALEAVLTLCQRNELKEVYLEEDEVENNTLTVEELEELYLYIDPTLYCHTARPAYLRRENLAVQKIA